MSYYAVAIARLQARIDELQRELTRERVRVRELEAKLRVKS